MDRVTDHIIQHRAKHNHATALYPVKDADELGRCVGKALVALIDAEAALNRFEKWVGHMDNNVRGRIDEARKRAVQAKGIVNTLGSSAKQIEKDVERVEQGY